MRMAFWQRLAVLALLGMGTSGLGSAALAAQFEHQEIEQDRFIMLAAPGGEIGYKLLILEQLNSSRPCWNETGSNPSNVEPLLLNFDFTGICSRLVDSNGFSIRTAGVDQALQYSLRVIREDNDLLLVAASNTDRDAQVVIGRTNGIPTGFSRIILDPGWRLTRRAYNGKAVGHVYITYDQPIELLVASARRNGGMGGQLPVPASRPTLIQPGTSQPGGSVIPVPSLPPGSDSSTPSPLPPIELPQPDPLPTLPQSSSPNLSTILPPPPPAVAPLPSGSASSPPVGDTAQTPADPSPASGSPSPGSPSSQNATGSPPLTEDSTEDSAPSVAPSRPAPSTTQRPAAGGTSSAARGSTTSRTPAPSRVPTVSNSRGALLRPRTQRQVEPAPTSQTQRSTQSTSASGSTGSTSANSTAEPTPATPPDSLSNSSGTSAPAPSSVAAATYQVIVIADSAETQDKVRSLAPEAFLTTINGQVVMQVGVFSNRQEADQLQQRFSLEGLPTAVIPVR